jgi:hypothetical protein
MLRIIFQMHWHNQPNQVWLIKHMLELLF